MRNAKLLAAAGGLTHDNWGETFSPRQFGFCGSFAWLLPTFAGIIPPSLKVVDEMLKNLSCAFAVPHAQARATPPARIRCPINCCMELLRSGVSLKGLGRLGKRDLADVTS